MNIFKKNIANTFEHFPVYGRALRVILVFFLFFIIKSL